MIALVPARGGSRRIPNKNIVPFFGAPMLAYTIAAAQRAGLFDQVIVSTDSDAIASVAADLGARVLMRPAALADNVTSVATVARHALQELDGAAVGTFCQLLPNCPLRRATDIVTQYDAFRSRSATFQVSVVPYRGVHPQWALRMAADGAAEWMFGEDLRPSDAGDSAVCPSGAVWWADAAAFLSGGGFYDGRFHACPIDANRGMDIDTVEDLAFAELLVYGLRARDGADPLEEL